MIGEERREEEKMGEEIVCGEEKIGEQRGGEDRRREKKIGDERGGESVECPRGPLCLGPQSWAGC